MNPNVVQFITDKNFFKINITNILLKQKYHVAMSEHGA